MQLLRYESFIPNIERIDAVIILQPIILAKRLLKLASVLG